MRRAEAEAKERREAEAERLARHRQRYPRGKGGPSSVNPVSGGLPSLGKRHS